MIARTIFAVAVSALSFAFLACSPAVPNFDIPKDADAAPPIAQDECGLTCWKLRVLRCREGAVNLCESTCAEMVDDGIPPPFLCLAGANTPDAVRNCGTVPCLP